MNSGGKAPSCVPTWKGHIETTKDALLVFEACFNGALSHCFRRPHDRERNSLIASGNVFVYEEATSGIKRWTDGIPWSPSRILTNFLIYRQLNSPFPPGEKKRATKRSQRPPQRPGDPYTSPAGDTSPIIEENRAIYSPDSPTESSKKDDGSDKDTNRGLVGSLVDSYEFKDNGLLKKTMTVTVNNVQHHLVSYYNLEDAKFKLKTPREDPKLKDLTIRESLLHQPKFKFPNLDDAGDGSFEGPEGSANPYGAYYHPGYDPRVYGGHPGYSVQNSQYAYHPAYQAPPSHYPPAGSSYGQVPPASSAYSQLPPAAHYPQHQPQYYQHPPQAAAHYHGPPPPQNPAYPHHYYSSHPPPSHARPPQSKPEASSRPNGSYDYEGSAHIETGNDVYGPSSNTAAPASDAAVSMSQPAHAQTWPMNYHQQWASRPDAPSYPGYRQQP